MHVLTFCLLTEQEDLRWFKDAMVQCQRERLLLDTTIWLDIAEIIPVRDHSLQGLRAGDRESLKLAVAT